jgi:hypothetical protein
VEDDFIGVWVCFSSRLVCWDAPAHFSVPHHFLSFNTLTFWGKITIESTPEQPLANQGFGPRQADSHVKALVTNTHKTS